MREQMKKYIPIIFIIISIVSTVMAQSFNCKTADSPTYNEIPTTGTIRVFFIFIQFKNDTQANSGWPLTSPASLPNWANDFVNSSVGGPYPYENISHYYNEMSNGNFQVIGDVYDNVVVTNLNQDEYSSIGEVNREVLQEVDPNVNFAPYDNLSGKIWSADGKVDLVFFIYRNITGNNLMDYSGQAHIEISDSVFTTNDGKTIEENGVDGGGVQMRGALNGRDYTTYVACHELGHYLFGGGHIDFISNLGLMTGLLYWNADRGMNSWERLHLGWISAQTVTTNSTITMTDYITSDHVIKIPTSNSSEFYLVENRKHQSVHDGAKDTGFYIYRVNEYPNYWIPDIDVQCADGNWTFNVNSSTNTVTRTAQNYNSGYDELNFYQDIGSIRYKCIYPYYQADDAGGDTEDAFDLTFNNVFSPKSNPRSTNFTVEVVGQDVLSFYFTDPYAGSPSKPQNARISSNPGNGYNRISWDANTETDLVNYEVSRKVQEWGGTWEVIATTTNTYFVDTDYTYTNPYGDFHCTYRVRAKDSQNKYSVYSDETTARAEFAHKIAQVSESDKGYFVNTCDNYPNPFNPSTQISFTIKERANISLKVYDVLGKEVASLADGYYEAGKHTATFDGSNLASGIYYYRLITTTTTITKKMMLVK